MAARVIFAVWPPIGSPVAGATWLRELAEFSESLIEPSPFPEDAARGHGQPVIVLPGFCSPNMTTARLRAFLLRQGFAPAPWDLGVNIGPTKATLAGLERQMAATRKQHGKKVALVGLSLGGTIAREMAKRRPELVSRVITLVSPIHLPVATPLAPIAQSAASLWDPDALDGLSRIAEAPPVPLTAIVSMRDGLVDWRSCVPEPAPNVETVIVDGAHVTIGSNPDAQRIVAARLAVS